MQFHDHCEPPPDTDPSCKIISNRIVFGQEVRKWYDGYGGILLYDWSGVCRLAGVRILDAPLPAKN